MPLHFHEVAQMYCMLLTMKPALGAMYIILQVTAVIPACDTHNIVWKYAICFTC